MKQVPAGKFKSHCLAMMDRVQESGEPLVITKRGKPVVKVMPIRENPEDIFGFLAGKIEIMGDIINTVPPEDWESE